MEDKAKKNYHAPNVSVLGSVPKVTRIGVAQAGSGGTTTEAATTTV